MLHEVPRKKSLLLSQETPFQVTRQWRKEISGYFDAGIFSFHPG
jgi:hypothetical protein